jgi:hypothetical protein
VVFGTLNCACHFLIWNIKQFCDSFQLHRISAPVRFSLQNNLAI